MKRLLGVVLIGLPSLLVPGVAAAQGRAIADPSAQAHWRALARDDLDFVHKTIVEAHPGAIDDVNPSFRTWMEDGYRQALTLLPRVTDYSTALDAIRWYVTGFRDGHLFLSDDTRPVGDVVPSKGWIVGLRRGRYVVRNVASDWPAPLPPVGATLVSCDERSPEAIATEDVAPYFDRRNLSFSRHLAAEFIGEPDLSMGKRLKSCTFAPPDSGAALTLDVVYRTLTIDQWMQMMLAGARPHVPINDYELKNGLLWIRAQNFKLDHEQYASLEKMLDEVRHLQGVRAIVFDVRRNGGGNSAIGDKIFEAATGGLRYDHRGLSGLPEVYAEWRVSTISIASAKSLLARNLRVFGHGSSEVAWARDHLRSLLVASAEGRPWARQDTGDRRLTQADMARRHARLRRFSGPIAVVTDDTCASACLDFVDLVRQVPGALQLGATTSADAVYIDIAQVPLPSGNHLDLPLKVWRNRLRGNNQPWVPDIPFDGDIHDDGAVRQWVASVLAKRNSDGAGSTATLRAAPAGKP